MEKVVLVDEKDNDLGVMEKLEAHEKGLLHRAFSIVLFDSSGRILLQQRAHHKYHSSGLWTNTCCSHPRPDEDMHQAAERRLMEEMGISVPVEFQYKFIYKARLGTLIEHEYDHVFTGVFNGEPDANPEEVAAWKFVTLDELEEDIRKHPGHYSVWFRMIMEKLPSLL
jgi:isopentenyl-diphosphate delta-isomerase